MVIEEAILGNVRSGKTFLLVQTLLREHNISKKKVVTNFWTTFSEPLNPAQMFDFELEDCILGITEAYGLLDSRLNTRANEYMSYFIFQSGKRDVDMYYDTQLNSSVDGRLRELAVKETRCENRGTKKKPDFHYEWVDYSSYTSGTFDIPYEVAKDYFHYYNTKEIIMPLYISSKSIMSIEDVQEVYRESGGVKKTFIVLLRDKNPYITWETAGSCHSLAEAEKWDRIKRLLRL